MGVATVSDTQMGGTFDFDSPLHQQQRRRAATSWPASCSALPGLGLGARSTTAPFEWFTKYYGAYVQDDWRVSRTLHR